MVQPIDYGINVPDPSQSFVNSFNLGRGIANNQAAAIKQQQINEAFARVHRPGATVEDYNNLSMLLPPEQAKSVREGFEMMSEAQRNNSLSESGKVFAALKSGNPEIAADLISQKAEAKRNSGDEQGAKFLEKWAAIARETPQAAEDFLGYNIANMPGGDKVIESVSKLGETKRSESLLPGEIKQQAAELGLTEAQARQAAANADKLSADAQKTLIELEAAKKGGVLSADPEKLFEAEQKLRKEYSAETKMFQDTQENFRKINSAEDTAAGDLSLIFSYMKMLDPGSVVREGEFATAQNAAGVPDRVVNLYNQLLNGERLNSGQRGAFKNQAKKLFQATSIREKDIRKGLKRVVDNYGLNEKNVFLTESPSFDAGGDQSKLPMQNAQGWRLMTDAQGNSAYVSPDGTQFQEAK